MMRGRSMKRRCKEPLSTEGIVVFRCTIICGLIIGYQSADTNSKKMVLFSVFTSDVKDNPNHCPYGSYYGSPNPEELVIKYAGEWGAFIKADISSSNEKRATVYFEKKWVEFEE